jgi:hypothetical protein
MDIGGDVPTAIDAGEVADLPAEHVQMLPGGRAPYIDYSYTKRQASPSKQRPSILAAAAATYGQTKAHHRAAERSQGSSTDGGSAHRQKNT